MLNILDMPVKLIRTRDHPSMVIAPGQPRGRSCPLAAGSHAALRTVPLSASSYASSCFGSNVTRAPLGEPNPCFPRPRKPNQPNMSSIGRPSSVGSRIDPVTQESGAAVTSVRAIHSTTRSSRTVHKRSLSTSSAWPTSAVNARYSCASISRVGTFDRRSTTLRNCYQQGAEPRVKAATRRAERGPP
jgi:hypothetical protein